VRTRPLYFAVKGSGNFPFHLLWLDSCFPATSEDAEKIVMACPTQAAEQLIVLKTYDGPPRGEEWAQRGWRVLTVQS
jgi:hypothetical protein